jgi:putative endonuclease
MSDPRPEFGRHGEQLAERFLRSKGYRLVARRFSAPVGELDLIMRDRDTLVFVEVKTRRDRKLADPQDAVNTTKQRRMVRTARWFVNARGLESRPCRFDVLTVTVPEGGDAQIEHFPDAFAPERW